MPRGRKTPQNTVDSVMEMWEKYGSIGKISQKLGISRTTVLNIVNTNKEHSSKRNDNIPHDFSKRAAGVIDKCLTLMERRVERALQSENVLDDIISEFSEMGKDEITAAERQKLVTKIKELKLQDIKAVTSAISTLFDKKALIDASNPDFSELFDEDTIDKLAEIAGFERI